MTAAIVGLVGVLFGGAVATLLRALLVDRPAAQNDGWAKVVAGYDAQAASYSRQFTDMAASIARLEERDEQNSQWRETAEQRIQDLEAEVKVERAAKQEAESTRQALIDYVHELHEWSKHACMTTPPEIPDSIREYL